MQKCCRKYRLSLGGCQALARNRRRENIHDGSIVFFNLVRPREEITDNRLPAGRSRRTRRVHGGSSTSTFADSAKGLRLRGPLDRCPGCGGESRRDGCNEARAVASTRILPSHTAGERRTEAVLCASRRRRPDRCRVPPPRFIPKTRHGLPRTGPSFRCMPTRSDGMKECSAQRGAHVRKDPDSRKTPFNLP
jgi:hypothetical protein